MGTTNQFLRDCRCASLGLRGGLSAGGGLRRLVRLVAAVAVLVSGGAFGEGIPREALPLDAAEWPLNYRIHVEGAARVRLSPEFVLPLEGNGPHDVAVERPAQGQPVLRVWRKGELVRGPEEVGSLVATGK